MKQIRRFKMNGRTGKGARRGWGCCREWNTEVILDFGESLMSVTCLFYTCEKQHRRKFSS